MLRILLLLAALWPLQACVFLPHTTESYDAECHVHTRHMELQPVQIGVLTHCRDADCAVILVAAGATAAASAVISGSIVVVGNVVHWAEKQGHCMRGETGASS